MSLKSKLFLQKTVRQATAVFCALLRTKPPFSARTLPCAGVLLSGLKLVVVHMDQLVLAKQLQQNGNAFTGDRLDQSLDTHEGGVFEVFVQRKIGVRAQLLQIQKGNTFVFGFGVNQIAVVTQ